MHDDHVQALIDLSVVTLGAVAVIYILRTPPLRRAATRALKYGLVTAGPRLLWREITTAWAASRIDPQESRIMTR